MFNPIKNIFSFIRISAFQNSLYYTSCLCSELTPSINILNCNNLLYFFIKNINTLAFWITTTHFIIIDNSFILFIYIKFLIYLFHFFRINFILKSKVHLYLTNKVGICVLNLLKLYNKMSYIDCNTSISFKSFESYYWKTSYKRSNSKKW